MQQQPGSDIGPRRNILIGTALFGILLLLVSCARKITFPASTVVPAAEGSLIISKDRNNNHRINLKITRLAEPDRLDPPMETYVVWMQTEANGIKNLGQLETEAGLLSGKLKSSLKTITPFHPTKVFITAEENADILYPGNQVVMETGTF